MGLFIEQDYACNISQPGDYVFKLGKAHKDPNYPDSAPNFIAESQYVLTVLPCEETDTHCQSNANYTPLPAITQNEVAYVGPNDNDPNIGNGDGKVDLNELPEAPISSAQVGATAGEFSVTPSGAASYTIPIQTAPGSGGHVPQLSFNYNSQGGRSALGLGWNVSGYSMVSRCGQTFSQDYDPNSTDPLVQGVNFTDTDRFCVDGQRLMLVTGTGDYGDNNAEYRTEIDTFTKFISKGISGVGPACFEAWHKNGTRTYYGDCTGINNDESALVKAGLGDNTAIMWAQSRMVDDKGNYYENRYINNVTVTPNNSGSNISNIDFYLDEILFTGNLNNNQVMNGSVKLNYVDSLSSEVSAQVLAQSPVIKLYDNSKRLVSVDSTFDGEFIRQYRLLYSRRDTAGGKLLTSVRECSSNATGAACFDPTRFTWDNTSSNSIGATSTTSMMSIPNSNRFGIRQFDANGDGVEDFVVTSKTDDSTPGGSDDGTYTYSKLFLSNGNGSFNEIPFPFNVAIPSIGDGFEVVDINADGYNDIAGTQGFYLWNGSGYTSLIEPTVFNGYAIEHYADMNGDGLIDALAKEVSGEDRNILVFENRYDQNHTKPASTL